jgi:hypothetical protein
MEGSFRRAGSTRLAHDGEPVPAGMPKAPGSQSPLAKHALREDLAYGAGPRATAVGHHAKAARQNQDHRKWNHCLLQHASSPTRLMRAPRRSDQSRGENDLKRGFRENDRSLVDDVSAHSKDRGHKQAKRIRSKRPSPSPSRLKPEVPQPASENSSPPLRRLPYRVIQERDRIVKRAQGRIHRSVKKAK